MRVAAEAIVGCAEDRALMERERREEEVWGLKLVIIMMGHRGLRSVWKIGTGECRALECQNRIRGHSHAVRRKTLCMPG